MKHPRARYILVIVIALGLSSDSIGHKKYVTSTTTNQVQVKGNDVGMNEHENIDIRETNVEHLEVVCTVQEEVPETVFDYTSEDVELLAMLLTGECGSDWCSDEMLYYTGSVVLNRLNADDFPDTLYEVIYQKGQYACTVDGNMYREIKERYYRIAEELLIYGSVLPADVIYQSEFEQGSEIYKKVQNMYFCYR